MFNFLRRKKRLRDPKTGKFLPESGEPEGEILASTRITKGFNQNLTAMTDTLKAMADFEQTLTNHALAKLEAQKQYADLVDVSLDKVEETVEDPFEAAVLKALPMILSGLGKQNPQQNNSYPSWEGSPQLVAVSPPSPGGETPNPPIKEDMTPLDKVNGILRTIASTPDKMITKEAVEEIAKNQGLDHQALTKSIRKLSKVV